MVTILQLETAASEKKNLQVRCDKKSQENKFKHFIEDQYEMIMESVLQLADCSRVTLRDMHKKAE